MAEDGYITPGQAQKARAEPLSVNPRVLTPNSIAAGFFAEEVRRELLRALRREEALRGRPFGPHHARSQDAGDGAQGAGRRPRALRRGAWLARRASSRSTSARTGASPLADIPAARRRQAVAARRGARRERHVRPHRPAAGARQLRRGRAASARPARSPPTARNGPARSRARS